MIEIISVEKILLRFNLIMIRVLFNILDSTMIKDFRASKIKIGLNNLSNNYEFYLKCDKPVLKPYKT
jgi:hypothetical protein